MSGPSDGPVPEFSRPVSIARLGDAALVHAVTANEEERAALVDRLGLVALDRFTAEITLAREASGNIRLQGEIAAEITQECVVTLEPFRSTLVEPFRILYGRRQPEAAGDLDAEADDFEVLSGDEIDIGEAAAQQLSLALDPFPRAPDAALPAEASAPPVAEEESSSPFAGLAKLAKK